MFREPYVLGLIKGTSYPLHDNILTTLCRYSIGEALVFFSDPLFNSMVFYVSLMSFEGVVGVIKHPIVFLLIS